MGLHRSLQLLLLLLFLVGTSACVRTTETSTAKGELTPFSWDNENFLDLVQTALSALPGVHMGPARQALQVQETEVFQNRKVGELCKYESADGSDGLREEVFGGKGCPIRIEVENFDQNVDMEKGIVRFKENVMYVRERTSKRPRQGLEVHSSFEFHLDFSEGQATPKKLVIQSVAKHLRLGVLKLEGEMSFWTDGKDDKILKMKISNDYHSSVIEFKMSTNELRIDGGKSVIFNDPRAKIYTTAPDLTRLD